MNDSKISIYDYFSAGRWLSDVYEEKKSLNPRYSLRAFAKDLDLSHTVLIRLFNEESPLSLSTLEKIVKKIGLSTIEAKYLEKIAAEKIDLNEVDLLRVKSKFKIINPANLSTVINLKNLAMFQMIRVSSKIPFSIKAASEKLLLSEIEVQEILKKLESYQLIQFKNGNYEASNFRIILDSPFPNSIHASSFDQLYASELMAFDPNDLPEAAIIIEECLSRLVALSLRAKKPNRVFQSLVSFTMPSEVNKP